MCELYRSGCGKAVNLHSLPNVADNWRVQPEISGGGYFHDLAPHQLDLMLFYFHEPEQYCGFSLNQSGRFTCR